MKKQKENDWYLLGSKDVGDMGLHLPTGKIYHGGFFSSTSQEVYYKVVGVYNEKTGEIKLFMKAVIDKIGINNIKL